VEISEILELGIQLLKLVNIIATCNILKHETPKHCEHEQNKHKQRSDIEQRGD
jgi:hypothetical protein